MINYEERQLLESLVAMYGQIIGTPNMKEETVTHAQKQLDRLIRIFDDAVSHLTSKASGIIL